MPDLDLSITICSWNTHNDLQICLSSLQACRDECAFEVIVFDNASDDGSAEMVAADFSWVTLVRSKENLGFGGGHNAAMDQARGEILFPLNSDTVVHPGALAALAGFFRANPDVGVVGPKLLNPDGSLQFSCRRFPTPMAAVFRNTPLGKLFPKNRYAREYLMQDWIHEETRDVDWVSGAAICVRRAVYERIGGFDTRFFMYMEDVDWCYRAHEAGVRVVYFPGAVITHAIGRSTDRVANKMIRQFHKSMMLFYRKHYLSKTNPVVRPIAILGARCFLWMRNTTLISKNKLDDWKRKRGRL